MSELGVSSTPMRYGTDQTPSYRPVREEWDMVNDPLLPQPTPRSPVQALDPDDKDFMRRYLECQNFDPLHVVRLVHTFAPPELDPSDEEEAGPNFLTDESGGRIWNGFGLCDHPVHHTRSISDRQAAGELLIDLSSESSHAAFLIRNHVLKAVVAVIDKSATVSEEAKLVEQGMSMLANITAFDILADKVSLEPDLKQLVIGKALCMMDSDVLIQVLRFLSSAVVKQGSAHWMPVVLSQTCLEQLMWIMDNTLNDTLLEHGFRFMEALMTAHDSSIELFIQLNFLDLLVSIFNTYVVKQSGLDSDTTLSPGTQLMVARKCPSLSGETVICATKALYSVTEREEAVEAIASHKNLLMCLYHLWLVSDYDRLDDQLLLVMATLNQPLKQMMYDTKGLQKLLQVAHFDYNSNATEVQMSAIWAVLSFVSRGLRLEAEQNRNMKEQLRIVTKDVSKLTGQKVLPSCVQYAQCYALNLIAMVDSELIKVKEAFKDARTDRGKHKIMGWWHRFESTKRTLAEWLSDALGITIEGG